MKQKKKNILGLFVATISLISFQNCGGFKSKSMSGSFSSLSSTVSKIGTQRLSISEMDRSLQDLFEDQVYMARLRLPADSRDPFDNNSLKQIASGSYVEGLETMAEEISFMLMNNPMRRDKIVGCMPSGPIDSNCMTSFIKKFGRRVFRRPLSSEEETTFINGALKWAQTENSFYAGVDFAIRVFIQHPAFVYKIEIGENPDAGLTKLTSFEMATRLSYFLWGTTPDEALLVVAEKNGLTKEADIKFQLDRMMGGNEKGRTNTLKQIDKFHAQWLGYFELPHDQATTDSMRKEVEFTLAKNLLVDNKPWIEILKSKETYIDQNLANLYGMTLDLPPAPGEMQPALWPAGRQGILSTGAFLSIGSKFGDTSPTVRGKHIRERLLCQKIPPPPPEIDPDQPPSNANAKCKYDKYFAHRNGGCASCHAMIDPIGFGLEKFSSKGEPRQYDIINGAPDMSCAINSKGELLGVGNFDGPAQLSNLLVTTGKVESCMIQHYYQFATGRELASEDLTTTRRLEAAYKGRGGRIKDLILEIVMSPEFSMKVID